MTFWIAIYAAAFIGGVFGYGLCAFLSIAKEVDGD